MYLEAILKVGVVQSLIFVSTRAPAVQRPVGVGYGGHVLRVEDVVMMNTQADIFQAAHPTRFVQFLRSMCQFD